MDFDVSLYLVTDSKGMDEDEFCARVDAALCGGVTLVQLREKNITSREYYKRAKKLLDICRLHKVPLLIDDRADIALAVGADGVHVGKDDIPVCELRRMLGKDKIIGSTAKNITWALNEEKQGADYLGVGAVFPTSTKPEAQGIDMSEFRNICNQVSIPVVAIGGLNYGNIDILKNSGAEGVAVVSAIMSANDPMLAAKQLKEKINKIKKGE